MTLSFSEKDKRYTWHPYTQHAVERDAEVIVKAKGASLFRENGDEILDMISSWWTCTHGHSHPELNKVLREQSETLEHVMFAGFTHPKAVNLAEKLAQLLPGELNRVFFTDNGSSSVEVALKLAYQYWRNQGKTKRTKFIAFERAYHGDTFGSMSVGKSCGFFHMFEDLLFDVATIPFPETWIDDPDVAEKEKQALLAFEDLLKAHKSETAAIIVEPLMQGAGGIRTCRPSFMKELVDTAHRHNILVIFDEIAVGFGRLGSLFACQKIGVVPDLICLSKGLTAGYMPMAVTVATDTIFEAFYDSDFKKAFIHGHTFTANPLACALALRGLELFDEENTLQRIKEIEDQHLGQAQTLKDHPLIEKIRVMGTCLAFNLKDEVGNYKTTGTEILRDWFLKTGFNIRPIGPAVYIMPPFCITDAQLTRGYNALHEGLTLLETKKAA